MIVAPRRSLGELRTLLPKKLAKISLEVAKDLTICGPQALWSRIAPLLARKPEGTVRAKAGKPVPRAKASASAPVVLFRDLKPSKAVETSIAKHVRKLDREFGRILSCRTVVEGSHPHHRKGLLYRVNVDVRVPGRMVLAKSDGGQDYAHEDVYAAIGDAFAAVARQLQGRAGRTGAGTRQAERSSSLRGRRADMM